MVTPRVWDIAADPRVPLACCTVWWALTIGLSVFFIFSYYWDVLGVNVFAPPPPPAPPSISYIKPCQGKYLIDGCNPTLLGIDCAVEPYFALYADGTSPMGSAFHQCAADCTKAPHYCNVKILH